MLVETVAKPFTVQLPVCVASGMAAELGWWENKIAWLCNPAITINRPLADGDTLDVVIGHGGYPWATGSFSSDDLSTSGEHPLPCDPTKLLYQSGLLRIAATYTPSGTPVFSFIMVKFTVVPIGIHR